ncbi:MAG: hypothetical protein V3T99_00400 [Nitrososphaerales archaeon]
MTDYDYALEECDVENKDSLRTFREKRAQWIEWFSGEDAHSVWNQMSFLFWDHALFCTVNELRRLAAQSPTSTVGFNSSVIRLFDKGFVTSQAVTIRRLIEKPKGGSRWAVMSLRRLLKDIQKNRGLITRENYVSYDGLPYDPEAGLAEWTKNRIERGETANFEWMESKGPSAWLTSKRAHENFDRLSKVAPSDRKRTDQVLDVWFDRLAKKLEPCKAIKKYVDKFVAHASDPATRKGLQTEELGITLEKLEQCLRAIYRVAAFLYGPLLWEGTYAPLPIPQFDVLKDIDKPWISAKDKAVAHKVWKEQVRKFNMLENEKLWPDQT